MTVHDTQNPESREAALAAAVDAVRGGDLIVLPTDTVYGIGADAFTPDAVDALLEAKGRGRDMPPPVLIGDHAVLLALAADLPDYVEDLTDELWPGALTLILTAQPSLTWDLGETRGTVALRMPADEVALELLRRTGPLAVSSANRSGRPAALSVLDAATQLGDSVSVYLDGGPAQIGESSTILDTTVTPAEIVREGAISKERIIEVVGDIFTAPEPEPTPESESEPVVDVAGAASDDEGTGAGTAEAAEGTATDTAATDTAAGDAATADADAASDDAAGPATDGAPKASTGSDAPDAPDAPAAPVLDLPAEPEPTAESTLDAGGQTSPAAADEPVTREGGSESTPG